MTHDIINQLKLINWQTEGSEAMTLRGIASHRFCGKQETSLEIESFHYPRQVHGDHIIEAGDSTQSQVHDRTQADGIFTSRPDRVVAVQTADCLPVLMAHAAGVMAIHAGWRGLTNGILARAAEFWQLRGVPLSQIKVAIGPAIAVADFEVGPEVVDAFLNCTVSVDPSARYLAIVKGRNDRWHLDLPMGASLQLLALGLNPANLTVMQLNTKNIDGKWNSYRRDGAAAGRNWSWIKMNSFG